MRGGSEIGNYFKATPVQHGAGLSGLLATMVKYAVPLFKRKILPAIKNITSQTMKKAIPMVKKEGNTVLKSGLKEISDVLSKRKTTKQAWNDSKIRVKKRAAEIINDTLTNSKHPKQGDIFKSS